MSSLSSSRLNAKRMYFIINAARQILLDSVSSSIYVSITPPIPKRIVGCISSFSNMSRSANFTLFFRTSRTDGTINNLIPNQSISSRSSMSLIFGSTSQVQHIPFSDKTCDLSRHINFLVSPCGLHHSILLKTCFRRLLVC